MRAYAEDWAGSLRSFHYCIEVINATPSVAARLPPKNTGEEDQGETSVEYRPRYPGRVEFKLFVPNLDKASLVLRETVLTTQDDFVRLLVSGICPQIRLKWSDVLL